MPLDEYRVRNQNVESVLGSDDGVPMADIFDLDNLIVDIQHISRLDRAIGLDNQASEVISSDVLQCKPKGDCEQAAGRKNG